MNILMFILSIIAMFFTFIITFGIISSINELTQTKRPLYIVSFFLFIITIYIVYLQIQVMSRFF